MSTLTIALSIVGQDPLPDDVREQLEELRSGMHEYEFEQVEEALALAEMNQELFDTSDEIIGGPDDNALTS